MNFFIRFFGSIAIVFYALGVSSCNEQSVQQDADMKNVSIDSSKTALINVSGELFSIPSPFQTAVSIRESGADYSRSILVNPNKSDSYATKNKKALNLGAYGADMAYASLYDDGQTALKYFKALENLSEDLDIKGALDANLIRRLGANVGKPDSLLKLSGKFYEQADIYLKKNDRLDIAAMVLAGGWIESSYLTSQAVSQGNKIAKGRLAAQQKTLETLCDVLSKVADEEFQSGPVMQTMDSLRIAFEKVEKNYTYQAPVTDRENKTTRITSRSSYALSADNLREITRLIANIRRDMIN